MQNKHTISRQRLGRQIGEKERLKLKAQGNKPSVWSGLGLFGMVGWSVAVPTLIGAALGIWLDKNHPGNHPWALTCLVAGLVIGCVVAWGWVNKEHKEIHQKEEVQDE